MREDAVDDGARRAEARNSAWIAGGDLFFGFLTRALVVGAISYAGVVTGSSTLSWLSLFATVVLGGVTAAEINRYSRLLWPKQTPLAEGAGILISLVLTGAFVWLLADVFAGVAA